MKWAVERGVDSSTWSTIGARSGYSSMYCFSRASVIVDLNASYDSPRRRQRVPYHGSNDIHGTNVIASPVWRWSGPESWAGSLRDGKLVNKTGA